jgi:hypothetical protein
MPIAVAYRRAPREGIALIAVLCFLVVCALGTTAVFFARRTSTRNTIGIVGGAQLLATAEAAAYETVANWDSNTRLQQALGSTATSEGVEPNDVTATVYLTRLTLRIFSIVAEARDRRGVAARRVALLVRVPLEQNRPRAALVSAVDVTLGPNARIVVDTGRCNDGVAAAVVLAPTATITADSVPVAERPRIREDSTAADSTTYLRLSAEWWNELIHRADIQLPPDTHLSPRPTIVSGQCIAADDNWGDDNSLTSPCAARAPLVYAAGDLTIDDGGGQGVLLVDGHLSIRGPFTFSGQIVARHGMETLADNIAISGEVYAWRASADTTQMHASSFAVMLTHQTTLRYSGCDARHGMASWLAPRIVRERSWTELF